MRHYTLYAISDNPEPIEITEVTEDGRIIGYQAVATERVGAVVNHATDPVEALAQLRAELAGADGHPLPTDAALDILPLDPSYRDLMG